MLVVAALSIAMLLTIWFKTNAVVEYANLLRVTRFVGPLKEFDQMRADIPDLLFVTYLSEHHNSFLSRLLTCPICVSTWLGILFSLLIASPVLALSISFLGLFLYLALAKLLTNA